MINRFIAQKTQEAQKFHQLSLINLQWGNETAAIAAIKHEILAIEAIPYPFMNESNLRQSAEAYANLAELLYAHVNHGEMSDSSQEESDTNDADPDDTSISQYTSIICRAIFLFNSIAVRSDDDLLKIAQLYRTYALTIIKHDDNTPVNINKAEIALISAINLIGRIENKSIDHYRFAKRLHIDHINLCKSSQDDVKMIDLYKALSNTLNLISPRTADETALLQSCNRMHLSHLELLAIATSVRQQGIFNAKKREREGADIQETHSANTKKPRGSASQPSPRRKF